MLQYVTIPVTPFQQNCSIVWCDQTHKAAVIDPGGDLDVLEDAFKQLKSHLPNFTLEAIWLTHCHIDHAGATADLADRKLIPIIGPHEGDQFWIDNLPESSRRFGFAEARTFTPNRWLVDEDTLMLGNSTIRVRHCPGHTPGHVVFYAADAKRAFVGDVLFAGSIGRTDFPRGDYQTLIDSITKRLWVLGSTADNDTTFISGHGAESTFSRERLHNPFVADAVVGTSTNESSNAERFG